MRRSVAKFVGPVCFLFALLVALSCRTSGPESPIPTPPDLNLYELTQRLRFPSQEPLPRVVEPRGHSLGERERFFLLKMATRERFEVTATLRVITPHAYIYLEDGVEIPQEELKEAARAFEEQIYPQVTQRFGEEWSPGVDQDPRLTILHARIPGVRGYFNYNDEYPELVSSYSNERKMIYVNIDLVRLNSGAYRVTQAHEFQHVIHWRADPTEEWWVNEGLSELAVDLAGERVRSASHFLTSPKTALVWREGTADISNYGASYLFMRYLLDHYGGEEAIEKLLNEPADGIEGINQYLKQMGYRKDFQEVFKDWVIANYLDDSEGVYGYPDLDIQTRRVEGVDTLPYSIADALPQYSARYLDLQLASGEVIITFQGEPEAKLIPTNPRSGAYLWWSNRGDSIDATLTREFNLSNLKEATLKYWVWYDIEEDWDFAYVEISTDRGRTWTILGGEHSVVESATGAALGPAYTGTSGDGEEPQWLEESIDLSPYAGKRVMVRFEYTTDATANRYGLVLDDISIPELGYLDDVERNRGWEAEGFFRTDNRVSQSYLVQLIEVGKDTVVRDMPLDSRRRGELVVKGFGKELERAVLVISPLAPATTLPARYELSIELLQPQSQ